MGFKLLESAQDRWRAVNGPHLVALVRAGARFDKGVMVERPDQVQEAAAWSQHRPSTTEVKMPRSRLSGALGSGGVGGF
jgi:hypothetical protein